MRVLFFGTDDFALRSLRLLFRSCEISRLEVVCPRIRRRGVPTGAVQLFCLENDIPHYEINSKRRRLMGADVEAAPNFDIGVVASFGYFLSGCLINQFPLGAINVHPSLLPKYRGASPVPQTIMAGDTKTGVSIIKVHPKRFDVGDILLQKHVEIAPDAVTTDLLSSLGDHGAVALLRVLENYSECSANSVPQSASAVQAIQAPKLTREMSRVIWETSSSASVYRQFRALSHTPGIFTHFRNKQCRLIRCAMESCGGVDETERFPPGSVRYDSSRKVLRIRCGDGLDILCSELKMEGRNAIGATEFANGYLKKGSRKGVNIVRFTSFMCK